MHYHVLAADFDGTIAEQGVVPQSTLDALQRIKDSGRKLVLVTGRRLEPLLALIPDIELFDQVVVENGGVLFTPNTGKETVLTTAPPPALVQKMRERGVERIECGRVIVATWRPYEVIALDVISELAIDTQIIFNKDAVMMLPSGCSKAFGLEAALKELQISPLNTVCVGDAENDQAMMRMCGVSAAVANALDAVKEMCRIVTESPRGAGVEELCAMILNDDLQFLSAAEKDVLRFGLRLDESPLTVQMAGESMLVTGGPGGGKSTFAMQFIEQLTARGAQACIIDPEGDYEGIASAINLGSGERAPTIDEVVNLLEQPGQHCVASVFAIEKKDRPEYFNRLLRALAELRSRTGRPHWIIVDEAHYTAPADWKPAEQWNQAELKGIMFITAFHDRISKVVLDGVDWIVSIADDPTEALKAISERMEHRMPTVHPPEDNKSHRALAWRVMETSATWFSRLPSELDNQRHRHSLFEGEMEEEHQFVFRGANNQFNLRATNLKRFIELAAGLDDETWLFHLQRNDYSNWIEHVIKDYGLADEVRTIEKSDDQSPAETRSAVQETIEKRFDVKW